MQSIGGLINDIVALSIFIYFALLLHGKVQAPNPSIQEKVNDLKTKKYILVLSWVAIGLFTIIIIQRFL